MIEAQRIELFEELMKDIISEDAKKWLMKNGFFKAPASTKYHFVYEGGLFDHSVNVLNALSDLTEKLDLQWQRPESPKIIGMFHDLCKTDQYLWNPILGKYEWNKDQRIIGHGDKSVKYVEENILKLTDEEKACIRCHMGAFDKQEMWTVYTNNIHQFPNVLYTHTADMIASHIVEI